MSRPDEAWLPWLKAELESRGYQVALPAMPNPEHPVISTWIEFIQSLVGTPDEKTVLVGHSIGGQAVLRYLETVGAAGGKVAQTVLVASVFPVARTAEQADQETGGNAVLRPWFSQGVDAALVKAAAGRCTVILADNDPYISWASAVATFKSNLDPTIIIEPGKGHFNEDDHLVDLPSALAAISA